MVLAVEVGGRWSGPDRTGMETALGCRRFFFVEHVQKCKRNVDSAKFPATVKFGSTLWSGILVSAKLRKQHVSCSSELVMQWLKKETDWGAPVTRRLQQEASWTR